jgi:ankyrin repeat protein
MFKEAEMQSPFPRRSGTQAAPEPNQLRRIGLTLFFFKNMIRMQQAPHINKNNYDGYRDAFAYDVFIRRGVRHVDSNVISPLKQRFKTVLGTSDHPGLRAQIERSTDSRTEIGQMLSLNVFLKQKTNDVHQLAVRLIEYITNMHEIANAPLSSEETQELSDFFLRDLYGAISDTDEVDLDVMWTSLVKSLIIQQSTRYPRFSDKIRSLLDHFELPQQENEQENEDDPDAREGRAAQYTQFILKGFGLECEALRHQQQMYQLCFTDVSLLNEKERSELLEEIRIYPKLLMFANVDNAQYLYDLGFQVDPIRIVRSRKDQNGVAASVIQTDVENLTTCSLQDLFYAALKLESYGLLKVAVREKQARLQRESAVQVRQVMDDLVTRVEKGDLGQDPTGKAQIGNEVDQGTAQDQQTHTQAAQEPNDMIDEKVWFDLCDLAMQKPALRTPIIDLILLDTYETITIGGRSERRPYPQYKSLYNRLLVESASRGNITFLEKLMESGANLDSRNGDGYGDTALIVATDKGHMAIVEKLIEGGATLDITNNKGHTALYRACSNGATAIVDKLITHRANTNIGELDGMTPLIIACRDGEMEILKSLIGAGADVNQAMNNGQTPIMVACELGKEEIFNVLKNSGASIHVRNTDGRTVLMSACIGNNQPIIDQLLASGVDLDARTTTDAKLTALTTACIKGNEGVVGSLLDKGAELRSIDLSMACIEGHQEVLATLIAKRDVSAADIDGQVPLNHIDEDGQTPLDLACTVENEAIVDQLIEAGVAIDDMALYHACIDGHEAIVDKLISEDANPNGKFNGIPALTVAAQKGHESIIDKLIGAGADVNVVDEDGTTALMHAGFQGHESIIDKLIGAGADVNVADDDGTTALIAVAYCEQECLASAEKLIKEGSDVDVVDNEGRTALHYAAESGHEAIVAELIKAGSDVDVVDKEGRTELHYAAQNGYEAIVAQLIPKVDDINVKDNEGITALMAVASCKKRSLLNTEKLITAGADVNIRGKKGETALILACQRGHEDIVMKLLENQSIDINATTSGGDTALIGACEKGDFLYSRITVTLLNRGADVNLANNEGVTPLMMASKHDRDVSLINEDYTIENLIAAGADVNHQSTSGQTALMVACEGRLLSITEILLKSGANVNLPDGEGMTPLIKACEEGQEAIVDRLLDTGADVNHQSTSGQTALIAACEQGSLAIVKSLMERHADINMAKTDGVTPLMMACKAGNITAVEVLIKAGAKVDLKDSNDKTALDYAIDSKNPVIIEFMTQHVTRRRENRLMATEDTLRVTRQASATNSSGAAGNEQSSIEEALNALVDAVEKIDVKHRPKNPSKS